MAKRGEETRQKILDAAENLFAKRGYYGVTIRQITKAASVDTALANYHFGSKRNLFDAVLLRRAEVLNEARLKRLDEIEAAAENGVASLEDIIDAFSHPLLDRSERGGAGWKSYFALIAQINNSPDWGGKLMTEYFDPLVRRFIAALKRALPEADEKDIYWSYHFFSGALVLTFAETGRIDNLSDGVVKSTDLRVGSQALAAIHSRGIPAPLRTQNLRHKFNACIILIDARARSGPPCHPQAVSGGE